MITHPSIRTQKSASGFSLIEVLIALVIISIGLLGIAALFVQMLKFN
ncbi:MAG: prepilin-type N-terminal cleavage/methylation domain-containing protein, partial [Gammaproteobacteria bacterium]